ncbi:GRAM domain-containing protein [Candidatus Nitrosotenuis sp. DW1]|uniref:GRAM domain-containing protein n=1 Tax=Candidatus Nitrosotenuis sp. DW1 TaxID=2259672 RepID=UPI0015CBF636|nr:GRAM domain-containing protein [Candidatus Nitrosotenuis sp. DW1]QLH09297.1 hypothetical protein DSQ19_07270 [Candidatus Nitrosotenuis sp. DW1]
MMQLYDDEKIIKTFEVKKSIHGKGILHITNYGVCFESQKYGIVIKVNFEQLKSYNAIKKNIFQIVWNEYNNNRFIYEVVVNSAKEIMTAYMDVNKEYADAMTEIQALKLKHIITD